MSEEQVYNTIEVDVASDTSVQSIKAIHQVPMQLKVVLGDREMTVKELLELNRGVVLELDTELSDRVDLYANDKRIANGTLVKNGDRLAMRITEIILDHRQDLAQEG